MAVGWLAGLSGCGGGGGNPNPTLGTLTFTTNENITLNGTLTAMDPAGSALTFSKTSDPKSGALNLAANGGFTYAPKANFTGSDSFGVQVADAAGNKTTGTVSITVTVDRPPTAGNTVVRSDDGQNINVLDAANDPDKDPLTVTISAQSTAGTATVNSDGTVSISGLQGKGLLQFGYTVTDPTGLKASGTAAVFVGVNPFRAAYAADSASDGSYEVYLTDFANTPVQQSRATQGNLRLKGFAASDNGSTVVYRTQDTTNSATTSLSLVKTGASPTPVKIPLPSGVVPVVDGQGRDQFAVSSDGNWVAVIGGQGNASTLYVVNAAASPPAVSPVSPSIAGAAAVFASVPRFTADSKNVYFLASSVTGGANRSLYVVALNSPNSPVLISSLSQAFTSDDISAYSVALNQATIVEQANRSGRWGLFYIDPAHLQTEIPVNSQPAANTVITSSTVGLAPGFGGSNTGTKVAYDVGNPNVSPDSVGIYVGDVPPASPPAPQFVAQLETVIGFSPDDSKLLYTDGSQMFESAATAGSTGTQLGVGSQGWYDSTGNIVLLQKAHAAGQSLTYTARPFGSQAAMTPSGTVAYNVDVSGFGNGVAIFGQAQDSGTAPGTVTLQLASTLTSNGQTPSQAVALASSATPLDMTSSTSKVVSGQ